MRIVMFSINPLFPDRIMGGAPKHLQSIAIYLGEQGHDVKVLSTRVIGSDQPFYWQDQVEVLPLLRFKQPFPQPYAIPAYDMAAALQDVGDALQQADRFYMHDGEFLFPYAYSNVPTVVSLRDNVYPETLIGSFLFQGDKLILISEYSRQYFLHTVGRFFPDLDDRIEVVHNGLDWVRFQYTKPNKILDIIPIDPTAQPIVLHPHRPEESKGIRQTIEVIDKLVHQHGITDVIALAPRWLKVQLTPDLRDFYQSIETQILERGLQNNFVFHDWIPQDLMPEYFSLGNVTLSMGNFVESFGNAVYESMGCGTPSVVARISTHRELLPDDLIDKVDFGDTASAAAAAARIIDNQERTSPHTMDYLHKEYGVLRQRQRYADVILNAENTSTMNYRHPTIDDNTKFMLAPWCYRSQMRGVYHDFLAGYRPLTPFMPLFDTYPQGFTLEQAQAQDVSEEMVIETYRDGFLVPLP